MKRIFALALVSTAFSAAHAAPLIIHYYGSLRDSNLVSLRKRVNNTIVELGKIAYNVAPGTTYNVRLEAIGNWLRVYVNGFMLLEKVDTSHPVGTYVLATYRTQAQFTNFVV